MNVSASTCNIVSGQMTSLLSVFAPPNDKITQDMYTHVVYHILVCSASLTYFSRQRLFNIFFNSSQEKWLQLLMK